MDLVGVRTLEIMNQAPWYNKWLFSKVRPYLSGDILEAGAGIGNMTKLFAKCGKITAIDYDADYIKILKNKGYKAGFGDIEKGRFFFGDRKFDSIVSTNVLEHIRDDKKALDNLSRRLKPKGKLVILVPAHMWAYGEMDRALGHYRRYRVRGLAKAFEKRNLKIVEARYLNWFGVFGWMVSGRVLRRKVIPSSQLKFFSKIAPTLLHLEDHVRFPFGLSVLVVGEKK